MTRLVNEPRLRAMMLRRRIDAVLVLGATNSKYLSGFFHNGDDHDGAVGARPFAVFYFLDDSRPPVLLVPAVDARLARDSSWIDDVRAYVSAENRLTIDAPLYDTVFDGIAAVVRERGIARAAIGAELGQHSVALAEKLRVVLPDARLADVSHDLGLVRMVKTPEEIARIGDAVRCTTRAHATLKSMLRIGVSDRELYRAAASQMIKDGAEGHRFIYIGAGPTRHAANARFPTGYRLAPNDFVRADMGASCRGYAADFVRSYVLGEATDEQQRVWTQLVEAEIALGHSIRIGETGEDIFRRGVREVAQRLDGFPREFVGHGIGLVLNEEPRMAEGNSVAVEEGTVYCTELSYYLSDGARLHIEDMFMITREGVTCLTADCPRDLTVPV